MKCLIAVRSFFEYKAVGREINETKKSLRNSGNFCVKIATHFYRIREESDSGKNRSRLGPLSEPVWFLRVTPSWFL